MIYQRGNFLLFCKTSYLKLILSKTYHLLCLLRSNLNSMLFGFSLINQRIYFFVYCMFFCHFWTCFLTNFFLSFDLTITSRWISLFMKGAWFARINQLFNGAIVFTTDWQVSLNNWTICSCDKLVLLVSVLQKMILVLLGSFCRSRRAWFQTCKSFESFWAYFLWSNQQTSDWWGFCSMWVSLISF